MINCWPKRPFFTYKKYAYLLRIFWIFFSASLYAQPRLKIHIVATELKASLSPEQLIELQQIFSENGVSVWVDQCVHPKVGQLPALDFNDTIPYFSSKMKVYRDAFFNSSHQRTKADYYVFLTNQQADSIHAGFALPGKHILFLAAKPVKGFSERFLSYVLVAAADQKGINRLALDSLARSMNYAERSPGVNDSYYLFHDDTENMGSKNGMVAFAFWDEDANGNISSDRISLPFKRNSGKVNLDINNYWLKPFYRTDARFIAPIHVALVCLAFFIMLIFRKKVNERADKSFKLHSKIGFFVLRLVLWVIFVGIGYLVYLTTDRFYKEMFFSSSNYEHVGNSSTKDFIHHLTASNSVVDQTANRTYWEVYTKERKAWKMKRLKNVLYFKVIQDEKGRVQSKRFLYDSYQLNIKNFKGKAQTHLFVNKIFTSRGEFIKEDVFNYAQVNITNKFVESDPARKILVFVNGYRPVANGGTPEQALMRIGNNGVEFPNSQNILFPSDRYNYWRPWGAFDQRIIDRIKPNEVFYADGHHSVATSNHGSVLNFTKAAADYPKPCRGKHRCKTCKTTTGATVETLSLLPFKSNKAGFALRRKNGRIAGRNLFQLLNEVPGSSSNDTLIIVAHSMGYAYALGMMDAMKSKCVFGSFYVFAPENAEAGKVITSQWQEVYQYGSIPKGTRKQAPCLQDGVAPQSLMKGLAPHHRLTFPPSYANKMGFTGSHFIGYFDWVLNIPSGELGAIRQR